MALSTDLLSNVVFIKSLHWSRSFFCFEILYLFQFSLNSTPNSIRLFRFFSRPISTTIIFLRISSRPKCTGEFHNFRTFFQLPSISIECVRTSNVEKQNVFVAKKIIDSIKSSNEMNVVRKIWLGFISNWMVNIRSSVMKKQFSVCF